MVNNKNISYQGTLYLGSGTELQPIRAVFDTGSANPWILAKESVTGEEHYFFDMEQTVSVEDGGHFSQPEEDARYITKITFGSGFLRGYFVTDTVTIGDPYNEDNQLKVDDWTFGMVIE